MLSLLILLPATALAQSQQPLYSTYDFNPLQHLAGITPYFEPEVPPRAPEPPQGCTVTRAAYLVRHAAINANDFDYETYLEPFIQKLANTTQNWGSISSLSFLSTWQPPKIEEEEQVTRTGRLEAAQLGVQLSYRYPKLRLPKNVWASSAPRTLTSAKSFIRGIEMDDNEINLVSVHEGKNSSADSLTPYKACPAYSGFAGSDQSITYVKTFTSPILARFRAQAPNFNWTSNDVIGMFEWCGYETVVRGSSPFCSLDLFSPTEWLQFEYGQDVMYHYNTGYGSPYSGAIGYPYLNATMNLLSSESSEQEMYVSFTHRELPPTVLVAMGLYNNSDLTGANMPNATMPLDRVNYARRWRSSHIMPFLSNIAIERMNCSASYGLQNASDPTNYRVLVNNSPQTLPGCFDGPLESCSAAGMEKFVEERADVVGKFDEECGVMYENGNATNVLSIYRTDTNGTAVGK